MNGRTMESILVLLFLSLPLFSSAYRPGDIVPMSKMGQYHSVCSPKSLSISLSRCLHFQYLFIDSCVHWFFWYTVVQSRTVWHDVVGKHCPIFAVNREVPFSWICQLGLLFLCCCCYRTSHVFHFYAIFIIYLCIFGSLLYRCWFLYRSQPVILVLIRTKCKGISVWIYVFFLLFEEFYWELVVLVLK